MIPEAIIENIVMLGEGDTNQLFEAVKLMDKIVFPEGRGVDGNVIPKLLPTILKLISSDHPHFQKEGIYFATAVTTTFHGPRTATENTKLIIDAGALPLLAASLLSKNFGVQEVALRCLGNIATDFSQDIVEQDAILSRMIEMGKSKERSVCEEALKALKFIAATNSQCCQKILDLGALKMIQKNIVRRLEFKSAKILQTIVLKRPEFVLVIISHNIIFAISSNLRSSNNNLVVGILSLLKDIMDNFGCAKIRQKLTASGGLGYLRNLCDHEDDEINELANKVYLVVENEKATVPIVRDERDSDEIDNVEADDAAADDEEEGNEQVFAAAVVIQQNEPRNKRANESPATSVASKLFRSNTLHSDTEQSVSIMGNEYDDGTELYNDFIDSSSPLHSTPNEQTLTSLQSITTSSATIENNAAERTNVLVKTEPESHEATAKYPTITNSSKLYKIMSNSKYSDVILISSDNVKIPSHRCILGKYSKSFAKIIDENPELPVTINVENFNAEIIQAAIDFMYDKTDAIIGKEMDVFKFARRYDIQEIMDACSSFFEKSVDPSNVCELIQIGYSNNFEELKKKCLAILVEKKKEIDASKFAELPKNILSDFFTAI
uniref:BTB domain-containing protein n=1 Tax=Panagrolaimus sp. ES5 TaxID=591445 RepID=A0AC34GYD4_9BILA